MEKRIFNRIASSGNVLLEDSKFVNIKTNLKDISENGICFVSNNSLGVIGDDSIKLKVNLNNELFDIEGNVKSFYRNNLGYCYGVLIKKVDGEYKNKIRRMLEGENQGYFVFDLTVYLKDVNLFGTGYFSRYFDWQGMAREEYFMTVNGYEKLLSSGIKLITKKAWANYKNHCYSFDRLAIKIQSKNIRNYSFDMMFTYFNKKTGLEIASGGQTLTFTDSEDKLMPIPKAIVDVIGKHQIL